MRSMRVTVCFGQTRVIVPCKGGATVAELVKEACARYKKAIGKGPKYWVKIRQLENAVDGGILDVDDYVYDVAEDRDQLIAVFDEEDDQTYNHHNGWDRQSGSSSDGRRSPVYHRYPSHSNRYNKENQSVDENKGRPLQARHGRDSEHEVNVGADTLKSVSGSLSLITVRRGSDLMLNKPESKVCDGMQNMSDQPGRHYGRRESGSGQEEDSSPASAGHRHHLNSSSSAVAGSPEADISGVTTSSDASNGAEGASHSARKKPQSTNFSNFVRDSTRQSIMGMLAEKSEDEIDSVGTDFRSSETRQPPDGRKGTSNHKDFNGVYKTGYNVERYLPPPPNREVKLPWFYNDTQEMFIEIDDRPLGVQVVSHKENKVFSGLLVKSVDSGGRSEREGLLQQGDIIVEINNYILVQYVLPVAQEIFKNAMKFPELQLRVYPVEERERVAHEKREEMNKALNGHRHTPSIPLLSVVEATPPKTSGLSSAKSLPNLSDTHSSKSVQSSDFSPDGKIPLAARISLDTLSNNTRKIGNMFEIELRKGQQGLGFSITTRDTPVGDPGPIYIKNILPKGAAIQDGRLRAGDRLLKVNDVEMTGHTQESAVHILRCIDVGSLVNIVVSRHVSTLPRKMKDDPVADEVVRDDAHREYFMFEIALNDTGSAGLGISLKGNQSKKTKQDLGIFVKAVFHGGAAYQDGRLRPNDQLVSVNGQSLIGMTNHEAIDTLRVSMSTVGNVRGMIQMVIARRKLINGNPTSPQFSSEASSELSDSLMNDRNSRSSFEITGHSREKYSADDSFQYNEEVPRQIDPNPLDPYGSSAFERDSPDHKGDWPPSPDPQDSDLDPFSRESIFRQSISEKRKGAAAQNTDTFKSAKSKQSNSEIVKKKPQPEIKNTPPASPLKWVKPFNAKNHHHSSSTTPARKTNSTPVKSPCSTGRNLNNSSNLPATTTRPKAASIDEGKSQEHKRSVTPRSFENRSETPSTLSLASVDSPPFSSKSTTADNGVFPPDNPALSETPKSSKSAMKQSHMDGLRTTKAVPVVKKSNSSESLVTYGIYSKQVPVPAIPGSPSASPAKDATNRAMPLLKPAVLPYTDIKHLAACCTPLSVGGLAQREISPAYDRRHPLTARREEHVRPAVEVGPTLGIAKSSSLESLQTAVENFESGQDMHYPRPKPRVLRGRVMNDSFRAALDQSYGLENVDGRPMATLNEENTTLSPLVPSDDSPQNSRSRSTDKRRAGKSYRLFGLFKVGKGKRSMSTDRNLDSVSSTSSSPRVAENEAHKRLLESKREDDYKKHQAETERIQAKAKAMREQQEQRKKNEEKYKSCDDLLGTKDERIRAPSVPVTAMQRVNMDPKVSYAEAPTGRRSVDPIAMRNAQPTTFEWNTKKRPTSPVNYARPGRTKASDKETAISKVKASPDYRSLPRQPRLESQKAGKVPDRSNGVVTKSAGGSHAAAPSPTSPANPTENRVTQLAANFDNYEFYNKQKPPATGQRKSAGARTQKPPTAHPRSATVGAPVVAERQGRALKAGRTLYYDDTDSSVSPSSTLRGRGAEVHARPAQNTAPRRPHRGDNGIDMSSSGRSFQRMESPEPPPVTHRRSLYTPTANPRPSVGAREHAADKASYRHSVHVDAAGHTDASGRRTPNNLNQRKRTDGTHFLWKPKGHSSSSDNSSYRTSSPASSGTKEQNRNAYKKMLRARYDERENPGKIVISPAYNL